MFPESSKWAANNSRKRVYSVGWRGIAKVYKLLVSGTAIICFLQLCNNVASNQRQNQLYNSLRLEKCFREL